MKASPASALAGSNCTRVTCTAAPGSGIYNPILHLSGAAALGALLAENRTASRRLPLLFVAVTVPVLVWAQRGEFRRLQERARRTPGRWSRRLRPRRT
jgi:hypothetical protein